MDLTAWLPLFATIVTAAASVFGVIISNNATMNKITSQLEKAQAVTDTKMENLTNEVRKHNNFAERVPVIEAQIDNISRRVDALERKA